MKTCKVLCLYAFVSAASACGDSPHATPPTTPTPPGTVEPWSVSAVVVSNPGGQPVGGAAIGVSGGPTITGDASGRFTVNSTSAQPVRITVSSPGFVTRETSLRAGSTREGVAIDLIADQPPFSMAFFRELAHGELDGGPYPIRRWQQDPAFYVLTIDERGVSVAQSLVDAAMAVIPDIVRDATGAG